MIFRFIIMLFLILSSSCALSNDRDAPSWRDKYEQWVTREDIFKISSASYGEILLINGIEPIEKILIITDWIRKNIQYKDEKNGADYWQTSTETLLIKSGDCEDRAILLYCMGLGCGVPSEMMTLLLLRWVNQDGNYQYHVVLGIYGLPDDTFESPRMKIINMDGFHLIAYKILYTFDKSEMRQSNDYLFPMIKDEYSI